MGSYSSPSLLLTALKFLVDNTIAANAIIIGPVKLATAQIVVWTSALYDGRIDSEVLDSAGNWQPFNNVHSPNAAMSDDFGSSNAWAPGDLTVYPYTIRLKVHFQCTVGTAACYITGFEGPANPLF